MKTGLRRSRVVSTKTIDRFLKKGSKVEAQAEGEQMLSDSFGDASRFLGSAVESIQTASEIASSWKDQRCTLG